jgi:hypothetical protein
MWTCCVGDFEPEVSNRRKENRLLVLIYWFESDIGKGEVSNIRVDVAQMQKVMEEWDFLDCQFTIVEIQSIDWRG